MPAVPGWLSERGMGVSAQCLRFERIALDFTHRCANATARICAVPAQRQQSNLQQPPFHCYLWRAGRVGSGERNLRVAPCHRGEIRRQGAPVAPRVALRCFLTFSEGSPGPRAHKRLQPMHLRLGARVGARDSPTLTCAFSLSVLASLPRASPFAQLPASRVPEPTQSAARNLSRQPRERASATLQTSRLTGQRHGLLFQPARRRSKRRKPQTVFIPSRALARTRVRACARVCMVKWACFAL